MKGGCLILLRVNNGYFESNILVSEKDHTSVGIKVIKF
jgi:hypothetical protein